MFSRRRTIVLVWLALLGLAVAVIALKLRLTTDISQFLPQSSALEQQRVLDELREGASARLLMMAIRGESLPKLAELSEQLARRLEDSDRFLHVMNGRDVLSTGEQARWFRFRYLLTEEPDDFSTGALREAFTARLKELSSPLAPFSRQTLAADPTAAFRRQLSQWQGDRRPPLRHGVWFSEDGQAVLFALTRAGGFDLDAQEQNLSVIRDGFERLPGKGHAQLVISGAAAIAVASRDTIRNESQWLSVLAGVAVALILLVVYRSPRLWILSTVPLLSGVIAALALTTLIFGSIHGITVAFGITLLGVAIDYPIHLFSHLQQGGKPSETLRRIWPTLRLGVLSTATGYLAMLASGFDGLVQLGVFTITGLLTAAAATRWLLPLGLPTTWQGADYVLAVRSINPPSRIGAPGVGVVLVAALVVLGMSKTPIWEEDVAALSPVPEAVQQQERQLREALPVADLNHLLILRGETPQEVLQQEEALALSLKKLQQAGGIGGYEMAAQWLPSVKRQLSRQGLLPDRAQLIDAVVQAQQGLPFRDGVFEPFIEQVVQSKQMAPLTLDSLSGTVLETQVAPLLFERDGQWWGLIRLSGGSDDLMLSEWTAKQSLSALHYLNLKTATNVMVNDFRDAALMHFAWGALLILLLLWWGVRDMRRVVHVVLPVTAAIAVSVTGLHLSGERLTLFHLTALLLVLGIGIDYSLFFTRREPAAERRRTGHALLVCAISTLTVFGILAFSSLPVLHAIGLTVFLGVLASYIFAWLSAASFDIATGPGTDRYAGQ